MSKPSYNPETKIWSGAKTPGIYSTNQSLGYLLLNVFARNGKNIAQINADTGKETTLYELRLLTIQIARSLTSMGYKKGDLVSVMATNSEYLAPLVFALFTLGMPINFLSPTFNKSDIIHMLNIIKPKLIFCDANFIEDIMSVKIDLRLDSQIITLLKHCDGYEFLEDLIIETNSLVADDYIIPDLGDVSKLPAIILCSSGTTGLPKGVSISHSMVIHKLRPIWCLSEGEQEVMFNFSTLYWITGIGFLIMCGLYNITRVFTGQSPTTKFMIETLEKYRVTTTLAPPYFVSNLLNHDGLKPFKHLKHFICGGSVVPKSLSEGMISYLPYGHIRNVYGCTELSGIASLSYPEIRHGSVGKVCENVEIKIIDDDGNQLGPMENGEICIREFIPFLGYHNDPEKTKEVLDDEKWLHTGDIGYFDDDEFLYIVDRKKDILKFQGYHVSPSEIEALVNELDAVVTSCVVGVLNDEGNDIIFAFVKRKYTSLSESDVLNHVHARVIDCKKIRGGVHFVDSFPLTSSGKVLRREVKEIAKKIFLNQNQK